MVKAKDDTHTLTVRQTNALQTPPSGSGRGGDWSPTMVTVGSSLGRAQGLRDGGHLLEWLGEARPRHVIPLPQRCPKINTQELRLGHLPFDRSREHAGPEELR